MMQRIQRWEVFELLAKVRLTTVDSDTLAEFLEDWGRDSLNPERSLPLALSDYYGGVRNGHLSELYEGLTGKRVEVVGQEGDLLPCPCCLKRTLSERYDSSAGTGYDICRYCGWEDDGTSDPSASSGVNNGSMEEYRKRLEAESNFYSRSRWFT